uniref:Uncharacterized protein n=1 Tax=Gopherus evgoodei TaxID=1825980 RepID=A0A8C4WFN2_9SAUR
MQRKSNDCTIIGKVAAHVPDLIVYGDFSQEVPFIESFDGVLLFADISGQEGGGVCHPWKGGRGNTGPPTPLHSSPGP